MRYLAIAIIFLLGCCVYGQVITGPGLPQDLKPCASQPDALCGKFRVFENRAKRSGREIDLNVVVLPAKGEGARHAPLFFIEGGPGAPAAQDASLFTDELKGFRDGRDIVLVDQRGTGQSNGLNCAPLAGATPLDEMYPVKYVQDCRSVLEKKADLTQYTTEIAMDDLDDVRRWLGYGKIDLMGLSYGTRASQVFVRRHPDAVGRVALFGAIGTYHKMPFYHSPNAQRALDLLLDECLADQKCRTAFPNIKEELASLISRLRKQPATAVYADAKKGTEQTFKIRADIFAEKIRQTLYSRSGSQDVPFVIHEAAKGNFDPFLKRVVTGDDFSFIADGMYLSVTCAEDVPFIDAAKAAKLSDKTIFGDYRVVQQKRACANWVRGAISENYRTPVVSDVPLLIVSGNLDPVTAPAWGTEIAKGFKNSLHLIIPEQGHGPGGLSNMECEENIVLDFFNGTPPGKLNTSCINTMKPPPFLTAETASN